MDVKNTLRACVELAGSNDTAKKVCFQDGSLKESIAGSRGIDKSGVKDSDVHKFLMRGARGDVLAVLKSCQELLDAQDASNPGDHATATVNCTELAKEFRAKFMIGKKVADITNDDLKFDINSAVGEELSEKMVACMDGAGTTQEKAACRIIAKSTIKAADMDGGEPDKRKLEQMLRDAAGTKAGDIMKDCDKSKGREACMAMVKDRAAKVMGKDGASNISTMEAEIFIKKGALQDAKDSALACVQAKKDGGAASATCAKLYDRIMETQGKSKPQSAFKEKQERSRAMVDTVAALGKSVRDVCFAKNTKAEADTCLRGFNQDIEDVANEFLRGEGSKNTNKVLESRKKHAERKATVSYLGERYKACMMTSSSDDDKMACKGDIDTKIGIAGVNASWAAVLQKFQAQELAEAATICNTTERKACMASAKADMIAAGLAPRQLNMIKKLAETISAAEVYATCKQSDISSIDTSDDDCEALAKEEFEAVSGADSSAFAGVKARIIKIADGIMNGDEIVLKKKMQLLIEALTSGMSCNLNVTSALLNKIKLIGTAPALTAPKDGGCRLVDGQAEYSAAVGTMGFTDAQMTSAAETVNSGIQGTTLSGRRLFLDARRLTQVTEVFTAQETEACASTDASCGQTDATFVSTTGGTSTGVTDGTSGTQRPGVGALSMLAMVALALMQY